MTRQHLLAATLAIALALLSSPSGADNISVITSFPKELTEAYMPAVRARLG